MQCLHLNNKSKQQPPSVIIAPIYPTKANSLGTISQLDFVRDSHNLEMDFYSPSGKTGQTTVYIVDDQSTGRRILEELIRTISPSIQVISFSDPLEALERAENQPPQLVLSDYKMPVMDGVEFTRRLRRLPKCKDIPLIMITIMDDREIRYQALDAGATDFLTRPIDQHECRARCKNLLTLHNQRLIIQNRARWLEQQVESATRQIHMREQETLLRLAKAGEYRDEETGNHVVRMARYSNIVAAELGLDKEFCTDVELAAPMHDIGKIGIPDEILRKPGRHTPEETRVMQEHTVIGHEILKDSPSRYLQLGAIIALAHHEKWDGSGYPHGLSGEDIPLAARIVALADVYDALTSKRPYKEAWSADRAVEYIKDQSGKHFDPRCVKAFLTRLPMILEVQTQLTDNTKKSPPLSSVTTPPNPET